MKSDSPTDNAPSEDLEIDGTVISPGERVKIELPVASLYDYTDLTIPVEVIRGHKPGPVLFISAAIHGDEIDGVESIKRILAKKKTLANICGTLIAVPIVNIFGFNNKTRYLPDRRDLNRCFPGAAVGPLASQIAHKFMQEIVSKCTHGIDLHCAAVHRRNLPQIRACLDEPQTLQLAEAFGVPVVLNSEIRDGSLRQAAVDHNIPILVFEGGEALRYDERVIQSSVNGILAVMRNIGMIAGEDVKIKKQKKAVFVARSSHWVRAPHSGSLRSRRKLGSRVSKDELLGVISDPFGSNQIKVRAKKTGIVIGMTMLPLVNSGDAMFHIATFDDSEAVEETVGSFEDLLLT